MSAIFTPRELFSTCLRVRGSEDVLVLTDVRVGSPRPITALAARFAEAGRRETSARVRFCAYPETGMHGVEPPESAWVAAFGERTVALLREGGLLAAMIAKTATSSRIRRAEGIVRAHCSGRTHWRDGVGAALFVTAFSITHTRFRSLLTSAAGARAASMPGFEASMLATAMAVDLGAMAAITRRVADRLSDASSVRIRNGDGTDLVLGLAGRNATPDTGVFGPGECGNLPAGEAYIAPVEGTAEGTLAVRSGPGCVFVTAMKVEIWKGRARAVAGGGLRGRELRALFRRNPACSVVAELGIGTNARARQSSNMLESEKALGTVHVAFGDNASFGGRNRAPFHQDYLVVKPTVDLTYGFRRRRIRLLDRGRLMV